MNMRKFTIEVKYSIGDKVWIMVHNYPCCLKIVRIDVLGFSENMGGSTSNFGKATYYLSHDENHGFTEQQLCDSFEELRDRVFSDEMRENIEKDNTEEDSL